MKRISRAEMLMEMALVVKQRSTCRRKQVGAVLVLDGRVLSTGYGGAPSGVPHCDETNCFPDKPCTRTIHAEANAIAFAARHGIPTKDSILYVTCSPCMECAKLLINAGIRKIIYYEEYRDTTPLELLRAVGIEVLRYGFYQPDLHSYGADNA